MSVRPTGSGLVALGSGYHPRYSRSGRMVAYGCGTDAQDRCRPGVGIQTRRADGRGRIRRVTRDNFDDHPDWSPDGRRIVFTRYPGGSLRNPELRILHRGRSSRLTAGEKPAWSIRGEIAFMREGSVPGEPWDLYVIRPDGSGLRRLGPGSDPEWSPSGRRLIYSSNGCGYSCLYTVRRDGRARRRLSRTSAYEPDFSPDGRWVVFSPALQDQVVVMRSSGRGRRVLFRAAGDFVATSPDWQSLAPAR